LFSTTILQKGTFPTGYYSILPGYVSHETYKDCISSNREFETLKELQGSLGGELLKKAIVLATMKNGRNLAYIQAILDDLTEKGLTTLEQVNIYLTNCIIKHKKANANRTKQLNKRAENINCGKKESTFNDCEQRQYNLNELEKKLLGRSNW